MNAKIKTRRKRPLSQNPLLNFSQEDHFLYSNPIFMNDELWKRKYNLRKLHEKWKRKEKINFSNIELKFGSSKYNIINKNAHKKNELFNAPNILLSPLINKKSNHNKLFNKLKNDLAIRKYLKNSNEEKNISVKCQYYNNNYILKAKKLKELIDDYLNEMKKIIVKKYEKEIKLNYQTNEENYQKYLVFREMILKYQKLFKSLLPNTKNIMRRNNSDTNLTQLKEINKINNAIYRELYIIVNYIKNNKEIIGTINENESITKSYFDVITKDELLRDKDINYQKYIINFVNSDNLKEKINDTNIQNINLPNFTKYKISNCSTKRAKHLKYIISFFHPGTYHLFNKGEDEYHAWSCCMNENKLSSQKDDINNFLIKREIQIQFISMNFNNKFENEFQENKIYFISNNNDNRKENNLNNNIINNDIILGDENNEDFFKQYTFKMRENDRKNSEKSKDLNEQIKQNRNTISNTSNNQTENNKFELNIVNKFWNKIINKIEITNNKNKKEKLDSRKNSNQIMKRNYTLGNEENNNIKKSNSLKTIYTKSHNGDKNNSKYYSINFSNEKILFEHNINKLMKLRELLKRIQSSIKNKNKIIKEDALIMFSCICLLSNVYFILYKDKESMKPLFKKRINLIKQLLVFKRANKFIIIIKFQDLNKNMKVNIKINNNDIYHRQNEKEENIIGILISKENIYIEFIKILKLLIPYLEIVILN